MTASRWYTLHCDSCSDCSFTADLDSATKTREKAARIGWTYTPEIRVQGGPARSIDTCFGCAAKAKS